jgi:septal ring factor EnvC (AmiA/AmiB activator)
MHEDNLVSYGKLFALSLRYFNGHGPAASPIFRTLNLNLVLTRENVQSLSALENLDWSVLNPSVGRVILDLVQLRDEREAQLAAARAELDRQQTVNAALQSNIEQHRKDSGQYRGTIEKLQIELERQQQANRKAESELVDQQQAKKARK